MDKYASEGLKEIEETKVLQLHEFQQFGSPMKIVKAFGGKAAYEQGCERTGRLKSSLCEMRSNMIDNY